MLGPSDTAASGGPRAVEHPRVGAATGPGTSWSAVDHLDEVTSTNDVALARLREGDQPGLVVVADRQTRGRGRAGRGWEDGPSPDASLMLTAAVRAPDADLSLVPLAVGLAVVDAAAAAGITLELKWPNDVLADGRKCVGILVERHRVADLDVLLLGVGFDVDWRGTDRSDERALWTSLAEERGGDVDRFELLGDLLDALASRLEAVTTSPTALLTDYRRRCVTLHRDVQAQRPGGGTIVGRAVDVDAAGRLLVDTDTERVAITAGDVTHVRATD